MAGMLDSSDEGKRVVTQDGDTIGEVRDVQGEEAHVTPEPGLTDSVRQRLGMDDDSDTYVLDESEIDATSEDEIRLQN
ncbi:PRC-barrel domain containing protein [Halobacterium sp. R2-5]|nr:PRC-barrel domain containing protein [Halobacterium sp. R2-5]